MDGEVLAAVGLGGDRALRDGDGGGGGEALDRAEEVDERGEVVGAHVEHGTAAELVVELGGGVPGFVAAAHHKCGEGEGATDGALLDEAARGLDTGAEEGVG